MSFSVPFSQAVRTSRGKSLRIRLTLEKAMALKALSP